MIGNLLKFDVSAPIDLQEMTNPQVVDYLVLTHHEFTRDIMLEIDRLLENGRVSEPEAQKVLAELGMLWPAFHREMLEHLEHEEQILFPSIESSTNEQGEISADNIDSTILSMIKEHDHHDDELHRIRILNARLLAQSGSNPVIHQLCQRIGQLDSDLHQHMQIESEILFPRILKSFT